MLLKDIKFPIETFAQDVLEKVSQEIQTTSEMTVLERKFLNGLLNYFRPRKILEIGVSAGGSSAIILNTIKNSEKAKLFSVDYSISYYKDSLLDVGWKAKELFSGNRQWTLKIGVDVAEVIEEIGSGIDFVLLDTVHRHPAETLSFISIFPYLSPRCVVVLHDINLFDPNFSEVNIAYATKILFDTIAADKIVPILGDNNIHPNIGVFQINEDTLKYISDVFRSLYFPWGFQVDKRILNATERIVKTKYSYENFELFQKSITRMSELLRPYRPGPPPVLMFQGTVYPISAPGFTKSTSGFDEVNAWGVWNNGNYASIVFKKPDHISDMTLHLVARFFVVPPKISSQRVNLFINGQFLATLEGDSMTSVAKNFSIKKDMMEGERGYISLEFEFPGAVSPVELGLNDYDHRKLAMGLCKIEIL